MARSYAVNPGTYGTVRRSSSAIFTASAGYSEIRRAVKGFVQYAQTHAVDWTAAVGGVGSGTGVAVGPIWATTATGEERFAPEQYIRPDVLRGMGMDDRRIAGDASYLGSMGAAGVVRRAAGDAKDIAMHAATPSAIGEEIGDIFSRRPKLTRTDNLSIARAEMRAAAGRAFTKRYVRPLASVQTRWSILARAVSPFAGARVHDIGLYKVGLGRSRSMADELKTSLKSGGGFTAYSMRRYGFFTGLDSGSASVTGRMSMALYRRFSASTKELEKLANARLRFKMASKGITNKTYLGHIITRRAVRLQSHVFQAARYAAIKGVYARNPIKGISYANKYLSRSIRYDIHVDVRRLLAGGKINYGARRGQYTSILRAVAFYSIRAPIRLVTGKKTRHLTHKQKVMRRRRERRHKSKAANYRQDRARSTSRYRRKLRRQRRSKKMNRLMRNESEANKQTYTSNKAKRRTRRSRR